MRIHQLTMSAFGPFPDTHVVDFEELNDAGVFLVTGPTGAGKTSILDAICFALFGQVPGGRGVKALRSDHAAPDARPEVALDFSIGGRRFVVRRTPEWLRPKRRGEGTTAEKAAASLIETTDGSEVLLSARAQEVGHFLSDLLGMTAGQFQQVAMLPQGEFQTFLRATSQERHDVLQQLFRTERFTRIEDWVHDHSRLLRDRAAGGEAVVRRLVDTLADRASVPTPDALDPDHLAPTAATGAVVPWADDVSARTEADLEHAAQRHVATSQALLRVRRDYDEAVRLHDLHTRRTRAEALLAALGEDAEVELLRSSLGADERATRCMPVMSLLDGSRSALALARSAQEAARADAPEVPDPQTAAREAADRLARLQMVVPREQELRKARDSFRRTTDALKTLTPKLVTAQADVDALPLRRESLARTMTETSALAATRPTADTALAQATAQSEAASLVPAAERLLAEQEDRARDARDAAASARERMIEVIERRVLGMAAELAGALVDGEPCQVCGSPDHPAPASTSADAVDQAAQVAATTESDNLRIVYEASVARVQDTRLKLEALRQAAAGLDPATAARQLDDRRRAVDEAIAAERAFAAAADELARLDSESAVLGAELRRLQDESARLTVTLVGQTEAIGVLEAEISAELDGQASLGDAVALARSRSHALAVLDEATETLRRATADVERHQRAADEAARAQGFADATDAGGSVLGEAERARSRAAVAAHDQAAHSARAVLADPAVQALPDESADLALLRDSLDRATAEEAAAGREHHLKQSVMSAVSTQRERLMEALEQWAPARDLYLTADSLSRLVRGMGSDNQLQLRLSSYVLATRLDQVLAAANERLTHMREQRYLLERTGDAARRGSQAGLGLRVVDEWTGESRDPATLSGGETFVVSLALALGLSDVVSHESGGVQLATLFIDEGFGMLDLDTLDDVMDRLDGLRAGGRTVGVISHVTELRNRIPTQVHVAKQRNGSSVSVTTLIA